MGLLVKSSSTRKPAASKCFFVSADGERSGLACTLEWRVRSVLSQVCSKSGNTTCWSCGKQDGTWFFLIGGTWGESCSTRERRHPRGGQGCRRQFCLTPSTATR